MSVVIEFSEKVLTFVSNIFAQNAGEMIAAFGGALFGALFAFFFENWRERARRQNEKHSAILTVQMVLIYNLNALENIRRSHLEPFRKMENRERFMPQFHQATNETRVNFEAVNFFLVGKDANLLMSLYVADRGFVNAVESVKLRNAEYLKLFEGGDTLKFNEATGATQMYADMQQIKILKDATDALFDTIDKAFESNTAAFDELRAAAKKLFPRRKFLIQPF